MKIVATYSHLNGLEFLIVHKPNLWEEIKTVIEYIDANACKTKISSSYNRNRSIIALYKKDENTN